MSAIRTTKINRWDGGIVNDPRDKRPGVCRCITNFDVYTNPHRITPFRDAEDGDSGSATSKKEAFCIAYWTPATVWRVFSLGVKSGAATAEILMKDLTTGAATDLDDNGWATPANNQSASGAVSYEMFTYYHKTGKIYGFRASRYVWAFTPNASTAWADSAYDFGSTAAHMSNGIVHSADDIHYFGMDNKVIVNSNGSFSVGFTIPSEYFVANIAEYGSKLAIAAAPLSGIGNSKILVWDRDTTNTTADENIDWGYGVIKWIEEIDGYLTGCSVRNESFSIKDRVVFKYYTGAGAKIFNEIIPTSTGTVVRSFKQKINNRIHFIGSFYLNGTLREGIYSFGLNRNGEWTLLHERTPNNDTAINQGNVRGFIYVADYLFIAYIASGGGYEVSKTNDSASYTATSTYESTINPNMPEGDLFLKKQLMAVTVRYPQLPSAGQVVIKYKVDNGSYITIATETTDNAVFTEMVSAGSTQFTSGREYEFRLDSTGGAEIVELIYTYEVLETNV